MTHDVLNRLYDATEDDFTFMIGVLETDTVPVICLTYPNWTREQLELVRESFASGIQLTLAHERREVYVCTKERVQLEVRDTADRSVLQGPAWDARLENVEPEVARRLEAAGRLILVLQGRRWRFMTEVTTLGCVKPHPVRSRLE